MDFDLPPELEPPNVYLIGCGVVGQAILEAHLQAGCAVAISDLDEARLDAVCRRVLPSRIPFQLSAAPALGGKLPTRYFQRSEPASELAQEGSNRRSSAAPLAIESIFENREAKRQLLGELQACLGPRAVLCSNTSTLPIASLIEHLPHPEQCCGMHFFMPVNQRPLVEIVVPPDVCPATIARAVEHARGLGKPALQVADTPGFVVNRMLSPYLNEAFRLLCQGATADQLERVATGFGMPFSPLELVDWIGPRTAFDAGRVYWQAFPGRLDPSPLLPGLVKAKLLGRSGGRGFYQYDQDRRSERICSQAMEVVQRYQRDGRCWSDDEVRWQLFLPMLIEAELILASGVVTTTSEIDTAMRGGLGFVSEAGFFATFEQWGPRRIAEELRMRSEQRSFSAAESLLDKLDRGRLMQPAK